jgi:hypothetical protein
MQQLVPPLNTMLLVLNLAYIFPSGSGISQPLSNTVRFSLLFDIDK